MIIAFIKRLILPKSQHKDKARKEFILNCLLLGSLVITFFAFWIDVINAYYNMTVQDGLPPYAIALFFLFLLILFYGSKKGYIRAAAFFLISFFYLPATYTIFTWGIEVTQAWLLYALLIVMSGILIGTRFALFFTVWVLVTTSVFGYLQASEAFHPDVHWKFAHYSFGDTILLNITLAIIVLISWLSNREIDKALHRARSSEKALKNERDLLEIKVEERTKALKEAQLEKVTQLYRFAELGRLSAGLFHDLVTPLSVISLNLEALKNTQDKEKIVNMQSVLKRAMQGTRYLESSVKAVRKQLQSQELKRIFSINKEIRQVLQLVHHNVFHASITIIFAPAKEIKTYGNPVKFSQIVTNLVLNAIDAYEDFETKGKKEIILTLQKKKNEILFSIRDFGKGINSTDRPHIFEPFFTTKSHEKGTGIGLSISRDIVEKSFHGTITVHSTNLGTLFTITVPFIRDKKVWNELFADQSDH